MSIIFSGGHSKYACLIKGYQMNAEYASILIKHQYRLTRLSFYQMNAEYASILIKHRFSKFAMVNITKWSELK